jgi:hypothetical protein
MDEFFFATMDKWNIKIFQVIHTCYRNRIQLKLDINLLIFCLNIVASWSHKTTSIYFAQYIHLFFYNIGLMGPHAGHRPNCKLILSLYRFCLKLLWSCIHPKKDYALVYNRCFFQITFLTIIILHYPPSTVPCFVFFSHVFKNLLIIYFKKL